MGGPAVPWGNLVQFSGPGEARATEQSRGREGGSWQVIVSEHVTEKATLGCPNDIPIKHSV